MSKSIMRGTCMPLKGETYHNVGLGGLTKSASEHLKILRENQE